MWWQLASGSGNALASSYSTSGPVSTRMGDRKGGSTLRQGGTPQIQKLADRSDVISHF